MERTTDSRDKEGRVGATMASWLKRCKWVDPILHHTVTYTTAMFIYVHMLKECRNTTNTCAKRFTKGSVIKNTFM